MMRKETLEKLDQIASGDRWAVPLLLAIAVLTGLVFECLGMFPRADLGEVAAVVQWSEIHTDAETGVQTSLFRAKTEIGKLVKVASPHKPPPVPGERVALHVRRNIIGWHSYTWIAGKSPALTEGAGAR